MSRRTAALLLLSLASACSPGGEPIAGEDLLVRVVTDTGEVELGKAFPLTVVRVWSKDLVPADFPDDALAPLTLRLVGTSRREDDRRVEESRRYAGYAFSLDEVTVPAPTFRATPRGGDASAVRSVAGDRLALRVRRALDPAAPGAPELPGDPLPEPFPWRPWTIGAALALAAFVLVQVRRLRAVRLASEIVVAPAAATPQPPGPHEIALRRIGDLRSADPRTDDDVRRWHVTASEIVRDYAAARFGLRASEMTTEELIAAAPSDRPELSSALRDCDRVKFARHESSARERAATLDSAEGFVRATSPVAEGAAA